jgi:hypothetical protein
MSKNPTKLDGKAHWAKRRSGKTTRLVKIIDGIMSSGKFNIMVVVGYDDRYFRNMFRGKKYQGKVFVVDKKHAMQHYGSGDFDYVFSDEIDSREVVEIKIKYQDKFMGGFFT